MRVLLEEEVECYSLVVEAIAHNQECVLEVGFVQCHQDWTTHDWYRVFFLVMKLRSIYFNTMVMLGVG
jgi:hypothetical protein